jgi:UDP:flavonoid glycosyltransferase YjiC (YdhE family)
MLLHFRFALVQDQRETLRSAYEDPYCHGRVTRDFQPYVALGKWLRASGHAVTICTSVRSEVFVAEHGLSYAYLNDDLLARLRAGRSTVICPFFGDQPFWGWRVHGLGVGSEPIPQKKLPPTGWLRHSVK